MIFSSIALYDSDTRLPPPDPGDLLLAGPDHNITIDRDQNRERVQLIASSTVTHVGVDTSRLQWHHACMQAGFKHLPDFPVFKWSYRLGGATATLNLNIPTKEQQ